MDKFKLQHLRDLPIEGVAERLGLRVRLHKSLCPFHEDSHPSLSFCVRKNTCRCFVCMNESMNTIDLAMRYLRMDFPEACHWLANANNIILEEYKPAPASSASSSASPRAFDPSRYARYFERPWLSDKAKRFLFDERRIDERVARWCKLTSWKDHDGTEWLQIPYFDAEGRLIGIQNRNLDYGKTEANGQSSQSPPLPKPSPSPSLPQLAPVPSLPQLAPVPEVSPSGPSSPAPSLPQLAPSPSLPQLAPVPEVSPSGPSSQSPPLPKPRFRFPQGSKCVIYNLPILNRLAEGDPLFITEGASDCWAMLSSGRKAIAIPSATLLSPEDASTLLSLSQAKHVSFHMYPDKDAPGERLFMQLKEILPGLIHHQLPAGCKDFADYYKSQK